jgi:phosphate uptake regulator
MKRKVIQIANSTQLISLPRKWAKKFNIKKGDELEIEEKGNDVVVSTEKSIVLNRIDIDISDLDRSSIMFYIRSKYRKGYDEINIRFKNTYTTHYRTSQKVRVIDVIEEEVNRLIGIEIVQQKEDSCLIKDLSEPKIQEFDNMVRRIFLLLVDISNKFIEGLEKENKELLATIEEKHDILTKFISYCARLINKRGYYDFKKISFIYHIITTLDKIVDIIKYSNRYYLEFNKKLRKDSLHILKKIDKSIQLYYELFFKFQLKVVSELYINRDRVIKDIRDYLKKIPKEDLIIISNMENILELLVDLTETRMSIEY